MTPEQNRQRWLDYLAERTGTYESRCLRYAAVADMLDHLGLSRGDLIVDVAAGMCDFDRYLRQVRNFDGRYLPVDGAVDGSDLNAWQPRVRADFCVAIETIEHVRNPDRLLRALELGATKGVVVTTPNPDVVDVLALDQTHLNAVSIEQLQGRGYTVRALPLFGKTADTIVAYRRPVAESERDDPYLSPSQRIIGSLDR